MVPGAYAARLFTAMIVVAVLATGCAGSPSWTTRVDTQPVSPGVRHPVSQAAAAFARENLPIQYVCPESEGPPLFGDPEQTEFALCLVGALLRISTKSLWACRISTNTLSVPSWTRPTQATRSLQTTYE
jgi:hypothetical protein